jgi:ribosomal protein S18 acetylase RimI-like enzyme
MADPDMRGTGPGPVTKMAAAGGPSTFDTALRSALEPPAVAPLHAEAHSCNCPVSTTPSHSRPVAVRIPKELDVAAAARLVGENRAQKGFSARRMVTAAAMHGIDFSLAWGTVDRRGDGRPARIRHLCLAVPGSGRTAMMMLAPPAARQESELDHLERVACVEAACRGLEEHRPEVRLAQALTDPDESWATSAFAAAGFLTVGQLAYLRAPLKRAAAQAAAPVWPEGITVRNIRSAAPGEPDHRLLIQALDRSYLDTLDCPELCGMRETADILDSHRATGIFNPRLWWLVFLHDEPHGCILLSHIPDHNCVELVYLGLSPQLRGRGLGRQLLEMGMGASRGATAEHIACAVDLRNAPARALYEKVGFREFGQRVASVKPIAAAPGGAFHK